MEKRVFAFLCGLVRFPELTLRLGRDTLVVAVKTMGGHVVVVRVTCSVVFQSVLDLYDCKMDARWVHGLREDGNV